MNYDLKNEIVLITGASSGLGKACALRAGELGAKVIMIARNLERLKAVSEEIKKKGSEAYFFQHDLENVYGIAEFYSNMILEIKCHPTMLINNAGYSAVGFVQNTPIQVYEKNYKVNTLSAIAFTQLVLPEMIKRKKGSIANIMSAAMYHSFPGMSSYYSSKFALRAIHESLTAEVADQSIKTLYVDPGGFSSNYWNNLDKGERLGDYKYPTHRKDKEPMDVAIRIYNAFHCNKGHIELGGFKDKIGYHLNYWCPKMVDKLIVSRNKKLLNHRPEVKDVLL